MFKKLLLLLFVAVTFFSCKKDSCNYDSCGYVAPASEIQAVEDYLSANSITDAVQHCSGLFYKIESPGSGATPGYCSNVTVRYKGMLTNGYVFDEKMTTSASFDLGMLIAGWRNGLPLIKAGGRIILYVPPSLGYGNQSNGSIPANSVLIFEIDLVTVQ